MLVQVTYIQKFIMADSEDEFMPIFVAASAAFVAMSQKKTRRKKHSKRFWSRPFLLRCQSKRKVSDICFIYSIFV